MDAEDRLPSFHGEPHLWKCATEVGTSDEEYVRASRFAKIRFQTWFNLKYPRRTIARQNRLRRFHAVSPYWCHVISDYALYTRVGDHLRPDSWPKNTSEFARFHGIAYGELCHLIHRVGWKKFMAYLFPPIPKALLLDKVDEKLLRVVLNDRIIEKQLHNWKAAAELFYKRHGALKTGGGIQINNTQTANEAAGNHAVDEEQLARALAMVAPYLPRLTQHNEVPLAEEKSPPPAEAVEPAPFGSEAGPEGDRQA